MKLTKLCAIATALALVSIPLFAAEEESPLKFSINVQGAYYPENEYLTRSASSVFGYEEGVLNPLRNDIRPGTDANHYSPITGAYSGAEGRITPQVDYTLKTPLGDNWLVSGANVRFSGYMGITPVSICPGASVNFTPLPFLVFSAGGEVGTGWDFGTIFKGGMGSWTGTNKVYDNTKGWQEFYLKTWFQGTFQFDTGAIIKGDWTHVLMMFTYQAYYKRYTGAEDGELWIWNCSGNQVNGWNEYMNAVLAYQFPTPVLKRVGLMFESDGAYSDSVYNNPYYQGSFKEISLSPLFQFDFDEHNSLVVLFHFKSRRTYDSIDKYTDGKYNDNGVWESSTGNTPDTLNPDSVGTTTVGREWFFNRIAISYTYKF